MKKMIKILFINSTNPFSEVENRYPPLWPAYLAAYVEKKIGYDVFDFRFISKRISLEMKSYKPDIVAISSVTQNYSYAIEYSKVAKEMNIPVIIGGIHITSLPETLSSDMDVGCIGEGEVTFYELMRHFLLHNKFDKERLGEINGIVFYNNNELIKTRDREPIKDLDELPLPKRSIVGYKYRGYVYTARGCAYNCIFCICSRYWGKIRYNPVSRIIEELNEYVAHGTKVVRLADENFIGNKSRLKEIADLIISNNLHKKLKFSCWCRANTVTSEIVDILKSINVVSIKMGLESGSQRVLDYLKGGVKIEDNIRAIELFKKAKIQVNADFIIGSPDETLDEMSETYKFIKKMPLNFIDVNLFSAYPGTPIWEYALEKKLVSNDMNWDLVNIKLDQTKKSSIILSNVLNRYELMTEYKRFKKIIFFKSVISIFDSPWFNEMPKIVINLIIERIGNFFIQKNRRK
jgi:anaerobic magnesium-protoporphyrin IX monomethyl ester cyclase